MSNFKALGLFFLFLLLLLFSLFYSHTCSIWKFLGQGSNNIRSLTYGARPGIEPTSSQIRSSTYGTTPGTPNPLVLLSVRWWLSSKSIDCSFLVTFSLGWLKKVLKHSLTPVQGQRVPLFISFHKCKNGLRTALASKFLHQNALPFF